MVLVPNLKLVLVPVASLRKSTGTGSPVAGTVEVSVCISNCVGGFIISSVILVSISTISLVVRFLLSYPYVSKNFSLIAAKCLLTIKIFMHL